MLYQKGKEQINGFRLDNVKNSFFLRVFYFGLFYKRVMSLGSNFRVKKILHKILPVANVVLRYVTVSFNTYIERKKIE